MQPSKPPSSSQQEYKACTGNNFKKPDCFGQIYIFGSFSLKFFKTNLRVVGGALLASKDPVN